MVSDNSNCLLKTWPVILTFKSNQLIVSHDHAKSPLLTDGVPAMTLRFCLPLAGKTVAGREYTLFPSHAPWQLVAGGHAAPLDPFSKELLAHPRLFKALINAKVASQG